MVTLNNVLKFIDLMGLSVRSFERESGLSNGTITGSKGRGVDLSADNIDNIVERYSTELLEKGFQIIDLTAFGKGIAILSKEEKEEIDNPKSQAEITKENPKSIQLKTASGKKVIIIPEGETEFQLLNAFLEEREHLISVIEIQTQARISDLKENNDRLFKLCSSNLTELSKVQKAIFAMVRTGLEYEAAIASRGDKKKEVEMLNSLTKLNHKNLEIDATVENSVALSKKSSGL
jgi:hypothetical protein